LGVGSWQLGVNCLLLAYDICRRAERMACTSDSGTSSGTGSSAAALLNAIVCAYVFR